MVPARPREVLESRIELWNRSTGEITFPKTKGKYNRRTRRHIPGAPRTMKLTGSTRGTARRRRRGIIRKVSYEETQESLGRHHPAFVEGW
ncbi:MAG: hypothetical protein E4G94_05730 [ANME-2 cluster archaeon]|nr:MAG: hypothetical protein E4G94_05730 [ANME-2 cluster archaeon]